MTTDLKELAAVTALREARSMIEIERAAFVDCHTLPNGGLEPDDQAIRQEYDDVLALIRDAIAAAEGAGKLADPAQSIGVVISNAAINLRAAIEAAEKAEPVATSKLVQSAPKRHAHPDDAAVDRFAAAMKRKLADKRAAGRGGWDDPAQCSTDYLARLLRDHVAKGDPVDVGNFAMMLFNRGGRTNEGPQPARQPMTSAEIRALEVEVAASIRHSYPTDAEAFARAIERHHGIGEEAGK